MRSRPLTALRLVTDTTPRRTSPTSRFSGGDVVSLDDFRRAVELLEERAIPPAECRSCGKKTYLVAAGTFVAAVERWKCSCGAVNEPYLAVGC